MLNMCFVCLLKNYSFTNVNVDTKETNILQAQKRKASFKSTNT